jgi:hypothetical protein
MHAQDPATPPLTSETARDTDDSRQSGNGEADLDLDLSELGLENSVITADQLVKMEKIGSGGFKEYVAHNSWSGCKADLA